MTSIAIDIGNTRSKAGLFEEGDLLEVASFGTSPSDDFVTWATNRNAQKIIFSSVGRSNLSDWQASLPKKVSWMELSTDTPLPFEVDYRSPETLGKDRIAAVAGAMHLYPNKHVLVVDAGTCITFDVLTAHRKYLGGNISPGLSMRYRSMHEYTARLPLVEQETPPGLLGKTTEEALQNGGTFGMIAEINYYQLETERIFGSVTTLLTGGDATFLAEMMKSQIFVRTHLVLIGLNQILMYNEEGMV